jgi:4-aminobutyrate aminotransferase-like enzyme
MFLRGNRYYNYGILLICDEVMAGLLDDLKAEHPSVGDVRSIGLYLWSFETL